MQKVIIGILVAAIIILVIGFVPIIEVPYTVTVQYLETEKYYEEIPNFLLPPVLQQSGLRSKIERERVVIKEREETRYKTVTILEYLRSCP